MKTTFRQDNTMIAVESQPATIDFQDILDATEVVYDEHETDAPWDNCDGFEHTIVEENRFPHCRADTRKMQGCTYSEGWRDWVIITLPKEDYGLYKYMRERGASRQVASEAVSMERRRKLAQLVKWYRDGWEWWGVKCDFEVLGTEYSDSLWGIDDRDYAETLREEIADNVASQLEKAGYDITDKPDLESPMSWARKYKPVQDGLKYKLAMQNWK